MRFVYQYCLLAVIFVFALASCTSTSTGIVGENTSEQQAAYSPAALRIKETIEFLADDSLNGREAGSEGYNQAAAYVAGEFEKLGLKPAGDNGTWYQQVTLRSSRRDMDAAHFSLERGGVKTDLTHIDDYLIGLPSNGSAASISAEMVFVGYGVNAPDFDINDYAGLDLDGKIAVMLAGTSTDMPSDIAAHYNSTRTRRIAAAEEGAIGVITVYDQSSKERFPWDRVKRSATRSSMSWVQKDGRTFSPSPSIKTTATLSPEQSGILFEGARMSYEDVLAITENKDQRPEGFALKGKVTLRSAAISEEVQSPNVLGVLAGTDPALKNEYVVLSAHLDHTGTTANADPEADIINNGALDNASGVATTLEAARMLVDLAASGDDGPRRSVVFAVVTAEEKGLLGSEYYAYYPTVPKDAIVANVNLDMPLITYPFTDVIAFGADHSSLGETVREAANAMSVKLIPDPIPQMSIFTRSDHYRFVQQGIPSVFLFLGFGNGGEKAFNDFMSKRYHRPGDDLSQALDYEQGARFAKLNYLVTKAIANADQRPTWNEGDFFGDLYSQD